MKFIFYPVKQEVLYLTTSDKRAGQAREKLKNASEISI